MNTFASSKRCSEKLFPKKWETPYGTPMVAIVAKIPEKEITVEEVPIISGVAILDRNNHNTYPESKLIIVSI